MPVYMIISLKVLEFNQNAIGMNMVKRFLNLEKKCGTQNQICKLIFDKKKLMSM